MFLQSGVALDGFEHGREALGLDGAATQHLGIAQHRVQRRPKLVRERCQELILQPIGGLGFGLGDRQRGHVVCHGQNRVDTPVLLHRGLIDEIVIAFFRFSVRTTMDDHADRSFHEGSRIFSLDSEHAKSVVGHELGHALGITGHSTCGGFLMSVEVNSAQPIRDSEKCWVYTEYTNFNPTCSRS